MTHEEGKRPQPHKWHSITTRSEVGRSTRFERTATKRKGVATAVTNEHEATPTAWATSRGGTKTCMSDQRHEPRGRATMFRKRRLNTHSTEPQQCVDRTEMNDAVRARTTDSVLTSTRHGHNDRSLAETAGVTASG